MSTIKERYPGAGFIIVWSSTMSRMSRIERLIEALTENVGVVVKSAAHVLSRFGDVRAIDPLINALTDTHKHWTIRKYIVEALGDFRDTTVIPALIMALGQEDEVSDMAID